MGVGVEGVGYVAALGGGLASRLGGQERGGALQNCSRLPGGRLGLCGEGSPESLVPRLGRRGRCCLFLGGGG